MIHIPCSVSRIGTIVALLFACLPAQHIFAAETPPADFLSGRIYDIKRDKAGAVKLNDSKGCLAEMKTGLTGFAQTGFKSDFFDEKYFRASKDLQLQQLFFGKIPATSLPAAFEIADEMTYNGMLVYYEGWITPPETAEYRFAGIADDAMMVVVDKKLVLWAFVPGANKPERFFKTEKDWEPKRVFEKDDKKDDRKKASDKKKSGKVESQANDNKPYYGRFAGSWIPMKKGTVYKMQVVYIEIGDGVSAAVLQVQQRKTGATASELTEDVPLPLFRMSNKKQPAFLAKSIKSSKNPVIAEEVLAFGCAANNVTPAEDLKK